MTPEQEANLEAPADDLVTRVCHEFAVNEQTAIELVAFIANELGAGRTSADDLRALNSRFRKGFQILVAYQQNQTSAADLRMSTRGMAMTMGFKTAAGAEDKAELARKMGIQKQTVNKCVNKFVEMLELEPLPGQRGAEARQNMSEARNKQLKGA